MADILQVNWRYAVNKNQQNEPEDETDTSGKYKLRGPSIKKRLENEDRLGRKRSPRTKTPSSKMSKYRRKTANARERMRMGEINVAYDRLKDTIPLPTVGVGVGKQKCDKLTKINLLHIAINYIRTLQEIVDSGEGDIDIVPEKLMLNPFREKGRRESESSSCPAEDSINNDYDQEDMDKSDSPDSGIQEDSDIECPDWTELNSTLDIRCNLVEPSSNKYKENAISTVETSPKKGVLSKKSTLGGSNNTNFKLHNFVTNSENKVTKCKPVTLTSRSPNVQYDKRKANLDSSAKTSMSMSLILTKQDQHQSSDSLLPVSNLHMEQDDLFNELNSSIDSFDGISDIDFCYDDPFKVF